LISVKSEEQEFKKSIINHFSSPLKSAFCASRITAALTYGG